MTRPPFPEVLDSTTISAFRSCPRKAELAYMLHWKPKSQSIHLHAGAAYASGLEAAREAFYLLGKPESEAIELGLAALMAAYGDFECPEDSAKSLPRMLGAFEFYCERYPFSEDDAIPVTLPDGTRGIEFSFVEPLEIAHPTTGLPLLYSGRMDMLCEFAGGVYLLDDKTTSSLGASWSKQWDLRSQFTAYTWLAQRAGFPVVGALVRGVSILKTKYDTQQAVTYRPKWMVDRWYKQLHLDLLRMIEMWKQGYFDYALDEACMSYGGCEFRQVCLSSDPTPWLEGSFERRRWDPVARTETLVEA